MLGGWQFWLRGLGLKVKSLEIWGHVGVGDCVLGGGFGASLRLRVCGFKLRDSEDISDIGCRR